MSLPEPGIPTSMSITTIAPHISDLSSKIGLGYIGPRVRRIVNSARFPVLITSAAYKPWQSISVFFGGSSNAVNALKLGLRISRKSGLPLDMFTQIERGNEETYKEVIEREGLKEEVDHLITVFPYVISFLEALRKVGKRVVLVTNAHTKSLELKMERTQLAGHFDKVICSHDYGIPKEHEDFWTTLQLEEAYDPQRTLLVDDSLAVLRSARNYGIRWLLAVYKPDSQQPVRDVEEFDAIHSFRDIHPV